MPNTYYIYEDAKVNLTCYYNSTGLIDAFTRQGCVSMNETQFLRDVIVNDDDTIIVYITLKNKECEAKVKDARCKKFLHSIDECKSDGVLFRTQRELCARIGVDTIINAYPSIRNTDFLTDHGFKSIAMPNGCEQRDVVYEQKDVNLILSGQLDDRFYPTRTRIFRALASKPHDVKKIFHLQHSGMDARNVCHQYHGKAFFDVLDRCLLGVTCRGGNFDRMLPKYVEFGFSKVLPVGDCPTYMPKQLCDLMVKVTDEDDNSSIIAKINDVLGDLVALRQRAEEYNEYCTRNYDIDTLVNDLLGKLANTNTSNV